MSWPQLLQIFIWIARRARAWRGFYVVIFFAFIGSLWNEKRKARSTEISIAFAMVALVASILIVYFDTAHKLKLLDARIENIEMSGPQTK
jgi:hypothetical protein